MDIFALVETRDGSHTVESQQFGATYHSRYGAIQESRHVFIEAGLFCQTILKKELAVLEMGFGTGLNALLSAVEAERFSCRIHYETVEAYPLPPEIVVRLNYPEQLALPESRAWFQAMHDAPHDMWVSIHPHFRFRKHIGRMEDFVAPPSFDLAYFDAFAPETQPELWTENVLGRVYEALLPGGALVTYCAKGAVKRTLKALGFVLEALPGPPGKREMTRAVKK